MKEEELTFGNRMRRLVNMGHDKAPEEETIAGIEAGVDFQGAKLWILVLAIFVASLGLNTNSTAVIIGAMLISPLMGPIIGMGLGVGIYDFPLLKRAVRNYLVATLFSVATATIYFLLTPIDEAQSELLARTSPTIYDVAIALCGGLAGIIALSSKSQRTGNVIPGVAIATALMPPLCTVGFGLATANWYYAAGALYLYLINTIFIALATFVGVTFIMRFHKLKMIDKKREKRVHLYISTIAVLTIVPSIFMTVGLVDKTIYERRARMYIHESFSFDMTQVISQSVDYENRTIKVVMLGEELDSVTVRGLREQMRFYGLDKTELQVVQGAAGLKEGDVQSLLLTESKEKERNAELLAASELKAKKAEQQLSAYQEPETLAREVLPELRTLFPAVQSLSMSRGLTVCVTDAAPTDSVDHLAVIRLSQPLKKEDAKRMDDWLRQRTACPSLRIIVEK